MSARRGRFNGVQHQVGQNVVGHLRARRRPQFLLRGQRIEHDSPALRFMAQNARNVLRRFRQIATLASTPSPDSRPAKLQQLVQLRGEPVDLIQHHLRFVAQRSGQVGTFHLHLQNRLDGAQRVFQVMRNAGRHLPDQRQRCRSASSRSNSSFSSISRQRSNELGSCSHRNSSAA